LASKLSGWKIDVKSEAKYDRSLKDGYQSLIRLPGVGEVTADALFEAGYGSTVEILNADLEDLVQVPGVSEKKAENLKEAARLYLDQLGAEEESVEDADNPELEPEGTEEPEKPGEPDRETETLADEQASEPAEKVKKVED